MTGRHFLFVQAPFGRFSRRLADRLRAEGHRVTRVIFNGGDLYDWHFRHAHLFWAPTGRYRGWIRRLLAREAVTDIVTYGDGHYYTDVAIEEAREAGLAIACLEQGYLRPNWITLAPDGVNGESTLPKDPAVYFRYGAPVAELEGAHATLGTITQNNVINILIFSLVFYFSAPFFPFYRSPVYMPGYVTGLAHLFRYRQLKRRAKEIQAQETGILEAGWPYYLALMQRPGDSQILRHAEQHEVRDFYRETIESFARHAPKDHHLVFKCHPLDQGLSGHARGIRRAAERQAVADRVHFLDGGQLARLARNSVGAVTVNSTAGLAALNAGAKTKALGTAVYAIPGLTYQDSLDSFWCAEFEPDNELFLRFRYLMAELTQVFGSYSTEEGMTTAVETCAQRLIDGLPTLATIAARQQATASGG
ncbi:MAG: capsule biosynthesis protein [Rhodospirillales bacterium]